MTIHTETAGISLHLHPSFTADIAERLTVFQGVRPVTFEEVEQEFYHVNALLPNFSTGKPATLIRTDANAPHRWHTGVGLFALPSALIAKVGQLITELNTYSKMKVIGHLEHKLVHEEILQFFMNTFMLSTVNLEDIGFSSALPGLQTVTINTREGVKVGMHFDTKDLPGLGDRFNARIRFNVNLGPSDRWFCYCPVSIEQALERKGIICDASQDPQQLVWNVYSEGNLPINCIRLEPGDGYFGPTDMLFHDASSAWAKDRHFLYQILAKPLQDEIPKTDNIFFSRWL
jgi:hypothetical protein